MKRFKEPFDNGGMPFQNEDWNTAQDQPLKAAESIVSGLQEPCIISGGVITQISPNITMSGGYCFLNGVIMEFDEIIDSPYGYLIEGTPTNEPRTSLSGATVSDFTTTRKAVYSATQPASGNWIRLYNQPYQYLSQVIFRQSHAKNSIVMMTSNNTELFGLSIPNYDSSGIGLGFYFGFKLCNGNGTIDLRDKFVKGADIGGAGVTGGNATISLEHNHKTISTGNDDGTATGYDASGNLAAMFDPQGVTAGGVTVSKNGPTNTDFYTDKNLSNSQDIQPPFYTLYYMQKV